jgi:hypothetical protein
MGVREKEEQIASMQRHIEDLKLRPSKAPSTCKAKFRSSPWKLCYAIDLPATWSSQCPEFGGDLIQRVWVKLVRLSVRSCGRPSGPRAGATGGSGSCGKISALPKADIGLIVSRTLPKRVQAFDYIDVSG